MEFCRTLQRIEVGRAGANACASGKMILGTITSGLVAGPGGATVVDWLLGTCLGKIHLLQG
jgi:hypothetical protein